MQENYQHTEFPQHIDDAKADGFWACVATVNVCGAGRVVICEEEGTEIATTCRRRPCRADRGVGAASRSTAASGYDPLQSRITLPHLSNRPSSPPKRYMSVTPTPHV
jgi:hypothetical protein